VLGLLLVGCPGIDTTSRDGSPAEEDAGSAGADAGVPVGDASAPPAAPGAHIVAWVEGQWELRNPGGVSRVTLADGRITALERGGDEVGIADAPVGTFDPERDRVRYSATDDGGTSYTVSFPVPCGGCSGVFSIGGEPNPVQVRRTEPYPRARTEAYDSAADPLRGLELVAANLVLADTTGAGGELEEQAAAPGQVVSFRVPDGEVETAPRPATRATWGRTRRRSSRCRRTAPRSSDSCATTPGARTRRWSPARSRTPKAR